MFYNSLIQTFLTDASLFTDVKAIVDCPLKVDPQVLIKACREKQPQEILDLLDAPGSDLEHLTLVLPDNCLNGRNDFLLLFGQPHNEKRTKDRRSTEELSRLKSLPPGRGIDAPKTRSAVPGMEHELLRLVSSRNGMSKLAPDNADPERKGRRRTAAEVSAKQMDILLKIVTEGEDNTAPEEMMVSDSTKSIIRLKYHLRVQKLGHELIKAWGKFYRRVSPHWAPDRNSLIAVPQPFIVPGGRFIEIYYWDSYWIIRGLLSSGLTGIARGIIENFAFCVERFGFIPNGLRKYYLDRSQPPLLSAMLRVYYHATKDEEFLKSCLPLLEREYSHWMSDRNGHAVRRKIPDPLDPAKEKDVVLNRYYSLETTPRPESYRIDEATGNLYKEFNGAADNLEEHFRAIRAGAESGWDFSSRWLRPAVEGAGESGIKPDMKVDKVLHKVCLVDIDTCSILPCDLNAFLFGLEEDLAFFADVLGREESRVLYTAAKERRREAMMHFLWDPERQMWLDYDMKRQKLSSVISAASFVPLWANVNPEIMNDARRLELASKLSCLIRPYGVLATNIAAGLQWDSPNVWACNHHIAVDFLCGGRFWDHYKSAAEDTGPAMALGINWASRFVNTVLDRFEFFGTCSEKYDCSRLGKSGLDGEYVTQDGFGWTNGSVLDFLEKFTTRLTPQGLYSSKRPDETFTTDRDFA